MSKKTALKHKPFPNCVFCGNKSHFASLGIRVAEYNPVTDIGFPRPFQDTGHEEGQVFNAPASSQFSNDEKTSWPGEKTVHEAVKFHNEHCGETCHDNCPLEEAFSEAEHIVDSKTLPEYRRSLGYTRHPRGENPIIESLSHQRNLLEHPGVIRRSPVPFLQTSLVRIPENNSSFDEGDDLLDEEIFSNDDEKGFERPKRPEPNPHFSPKVKINNTQCPGCGENVDDGQPSRKITRVYQAGTPILSGEGGRVRFRKLEKLNIMKPEAAERLNKITRLFSKKPPFSGLSDEDYGKFQKRYEDIQTKAQQNWGVAPQWAKMGGSTGSELSSESRFTPIRLVSAVSQPLHERCLRVLINHCPALKNLAKIDPEGIVPGTGGGDRFKPDQPTKIKPREDWESSGDIPTRFY